MQDMKNYLSELDEEKLTYYKNFERQFGNGERIIERIKNRTLSIYAYKFASTVPDLKNILNDMEKYHPALSAICKHPLSDLKTIREITPVDRIKKLGYEAIPYLASHPEDWEQKTVTGLKPSRLLSISSMIDYNIYENRVVKKLIDKVIRFLNSKKKNLSGKISQLEIYTGNNTGNNIGYNSFFGYDSVFQDSMQHILNLHPDELENNKDILEELNEYSRNINKILPKYLLLRNSLLYKKVNAKDIGERIHSQTNKFSFHKNYRVVPKLWRSLQKAQVKHEQTEIEAIIENNTDFQSIYKNFCYVSSVYALDKLNFTEDNNKWKRNNILIEGDFSNNTLVFNFSDTTPNKLNLKQCGRVNITSGFLRVNGNLEWEYNLEKSKIDAFLRANQQNPQLQNKVNSQQQTPGKTFKMIIKPSFGIVNNAYFLKEELLNNSHADNTLTVYCFPDLQEEEQKITDYYAVKGKVALFPLSLFDINSYRRIQKMFLKVITWFDHDDCPYCGNHLSVTENGSALCRQCNLKKIHTHCNNQHQYIYLKGEINGNYEENQLEDLAWFAKDSRFKYIDIAPLNVEKDNNGNITIKPRCMECVGDEDYNNAR